MEDVLMPIMAFLGRSLLASSNSETMVRPFLETVGTGRPTHIILTQVNALDANGNGDIHSVVDQQRHSIGLAKFVQLPGRLDQDPGIAGLVPVLHDRDT